MSKFKYVSLFAGIGGFDKPINDLGGECVLASEIDKYANIGYEALYGHVTAGDVTKIKEEDVPEHDLLVGGFPCFVAGTLVTTSDGLKNIEDVKKGDKVLTHRNRYREVVVPMVKDKKGIYKLKVQGSPETFVTEEHPYYVREVRREKKEGKVVRVLSEPRWVEAKELKKGLHYIGMSENNNSKNEMDLTKEDAWLLGRYAADGYIQDSLRAGRKNSYNRKTIFCIGKDKVDEFMEGVNGKYHVTLSENPTVYKCIITDKRLMELCRKVGRGANNKNVPGFVLDLPKELLECFLEGYISGDGYKTGDKYKATTVSKQLAYGIGNVVQKLYKTPYTILRVKKDKKTVIQGREVNQKDNWMISYRKKTKEKLGGIYEDGMLWMPVRKLEYDGSFKGNVYNFEVEEDNSYVANNLTVHNCQAFSISGLRKGFEDARGTLFFEIARIAKEKKPKVMLLENVKGLVNHDNGKTIDVLINILNDIGYRVDFKVINSKYFGVPQSRERIFFVAVREDLVEQRGWVIRGNTVTPLAKRMLYKNKGLKTFNFPFPEGIETSLAIKDIMEDVVDDRYYVRKESAVKLLEELKNKKHKEDKKPVRRKRSLFNRPKVEEGIEVVGSLEQSGLESNNRVYDPKGLAPTVMTRGECYVLEEDPKIKVLGRVHKGMSGVVYSAEGVSPTITTEGGCMVVEESRDNNINVVGSINATQRGAVHDSDGIVGAIMASDYKGAKNIYCKDTSKDSYIRRLTPKEYLRLQAFPEGTYEKLRAAGVSDSQIYKQAGNAVTLTVIDALVRTIISEGYLD